MFKKIKKNKIDLHLSIAINLNVINKLKLNTLFLITTYYRLISEIWIDMMFVGVLLIIFLWG